LAKKSKPLGAHRLQLKEYKGLDKDKLDLGMGSKRRPLPNTSQSALGIRRDTNYLPAKLAHVSHENDALGMDQNPTEPKQAKKQKYKALPIQQPLIY
jgi:hypothetical protein